MGIGRNWESRCINLILLESIRIVNCQLLIKQLFEAYQL